MSDYQSAKFEVGQKVLATDKFPVVTLILNVFENFFVSWIIMIYFFLAFTSCSFLFEPTREEHFYYGTVVQTFLDGRYEVKIKKGTIMADITKGQLLYQSPADIEFKEAELKEKRRKDFQQQCGLWCFPWYRIGLQTYTQKSL